MSYLGMIRLGQLNVAIEVPLGGEITVNIVENRTDETRVKKEDDTPPGRLPASLLGSVTDWPEDMAERHDFYLHGRRET